MRTNKTLGVPHKNYTVQFYKKNKLSFLFALISTMLIAGLNLLLTWLMQQVIDTVSLVPGAYTLGQLALFVLGTLGLILCFKAISYVSLPRFIEMAMKQYKSYILEKLLRKSIGSFSKENTATYLSAMSNDMLRIEVDYLEKQFALIASLIRCVGAIVMMLMYDPLLTLIATGFFILPILAVLAAGHRVEKAEQQVSVRSECFISALKDCLNGFPVIKSFRAESAILGLLQKNNAEVESAKGWRRKLNTILGTLGAITGVTAQYGTLLAGSYLALSGTGITAGVVLIFIDLTAEVINPIRELPELLASRKAALGVMDKMAQTLESNHREDGTESCCSLEDGISLEHVSFGYTNDTAVLKDIQVKFETGKRYAIVGASGSGKSTLLNLLLATYDGYTGTIYYGHTELSMISGSSLYDLVSMIQQNVFIFNVTIRENITMFRDFPADDVDRAICLSGLKNLIDQRGEGYLCGENGCNLSGGEKQRISIARSLLRRCAVLLVDEATAALDAQTAFQVTESILHLEGLTRIVVTHALDARLLRQFDCILAFHDGQIEEMGTFDQLMEKGGYFRSLYTVSH